jgi:hypothetical protein
MPTPLIVTGMPQVLVQNLVYATPVRWRVGHVNPVAASGLECSMELAGTFTAVVVAADGSFTNSAPFMRSTAVGTRVIFKA